MAVDTLHDSYKQRKKSWKYCRDAVEGDDAIKAGLETYVPKLSEQTDEEYLRMLNYPVYEGYTQRTLDGLSGLVFSKPPTFTASKSLESLFDNIDLDGKTLTDISQFVTDEVITTGRVGILVDMASIETNGMSKLDVNNLNLRPFMKTYPTESIINWKYDNINNKQVLSLVVLQETKDIWVDEFTSESEVIYRVLSLEDGVYTQRVFEKNEKDNTFSATITFTPKMNGKAIKTIPFTSITPLSLDLTPSKPPIYDLSKVNLTHFKVNVDFYNGMHFTALPTPWGAGFQAEKGESIKIGSSSFLMSNDPSAKLEYLEFTGDGLGTLEREKQSLKETMVILGSNMLQGDKNVAEAENTIAMRNAGQNASLISISDTVSRGIQKSLQYMNEWLGNSDTVAYALNNDYNLTQMDAQKILALNTVQMSGNLTKEELFDAYQEGEVIKESITFEEHSTSLEEETPDLSVSPIKATNPVDDESTLSKIKKSIGL